MILTVRILRTLYVGSVSIASELHRRFWTVQILQTLQDFCTAQRLVNSLFFSSFSLSLIGARILSGIPQLHTCRTSVGDLGHEYLHLILITGFLLSLLYCLHSYSEFQVDFDVCTVLYITEDVHIEHTDVFKCRDTTSTIC